MKNNHIQSSKELIITSMHRSGSSLSASLLQSAGLHIGRRLIGATEGNIKGHFENLDFWSLHQKVLKSQGVNEEGWTLQDQIQVDDYYREEAKNLVAKNAISGLWGWKDPRTTLFLDFWANLLPEANFLVLFRYPWEVVSSLYRGGQPYEIFKKQPELAIKFWLHYNQKILNFSNSFPQRCFLVSLNNFLQQIQPCIDALNEKFRINLSIPNPTIYQPSLLHRQESEGHRASLINHYYPEAIALYQELEARAWEPTDAPDTSWQEKLKSSPYRVWAFQDWVKVGNLQGENQKLQAELGQTQSQLHQTQSQLHQTQEELGQTQSQLHQTQEELGQTQSQLHQTQEELGQTQSQLHQTQAELGQTQSQLEERQTQLYQTEAMLSQYQSHLQQVETLLEQSRTQLHQKTEELEKTQGQLHQTQAELGQTQGQLHQTEAELGQTQSQLHQTEAELGQTQSQLHQTEAELGQTQSQLHQTKEKLGQTQSQLHQTEEVLEQSQAQLHETEAVLEQSVTQLQQKTQELQQSQSQLHQVQEELERSQSQQQQIKQEEQQAKSELAQTRSKLEAVQTQLYQTEAMLAEYQSHRQQTESALERSQSQLHETQEELERSQSQLHYIQERTNYQKAIAGNSNGNTQTQYKLLIWDGWYAYLQGDLAKMSGCLQQSLKYTSLSRTETIVNWLETFGDFASPQNGSQFDIQALINSREWQQLVRRVTAAKSLIAIK